MRIFMVDNDFREIIGTIFCNYYLIIENIKITHLGWIPKNFLNLEFDFLITTIPSFSSNCCIKFVPSK